MKKVIMLILSVLLFVSLTACSSNSAQSPSTSETVNNTKVKDHSESKEYEIGDIILSDGSVLKDLNILDSSNVPIAVVADIKEDGKILGLGLHISNEPLQWETGNDKPAFSFASAYGEKYKLADDYSQGWYIPSIEELSTIYENRESINNTLQKIYALDNRLSTDGLGTNWYWSSSQSEDKEGYEWFVHYYNGYAGECPKDFDNLNVLVVREF